MTSGSIESPAQGTQAPIAAIPRVSLQAFCESHELSALIAEAAVDRRMEKAHVKVNMGGANAAVEAYRTSPTPNVIVLENSAPRAELIGQLEALAEFCDAGTKVIVVGKLNDITLYRELISRGVSDYLVQPFGVMEFIAALSNQYHVDNAAPLGRVIADLDLPFGTAGLDFNQDPPQGIAEAVFAPDRLDANLLDRLLSKCSDKLSILAAPATIERCYDMQETAFDGILEILRASTPIIVLDVPHVWTAWSKRMLVNADEILVVASPELASLRNAKTMLDNLRAARKNDLPPRLALNGVGMPKRPEISPADFAKAVETEPVALFNFDVKLFGTAANNGQMIGEVEDGAKTAQIFNDLGRTVTGRMAVKREKKGLFEPLLARLKK